MPRCSDYRVRPSSSPSGRWFRIRVCLCGSGQIGIVHASFNSRCIHLADRRFAGSGRSGTGAGRHGAPATVLSVYLPAPDLHRGGGFRLVWGAGSGVATAVGYPRRVDRARRCGYGALSKLDAVCARTGERMRYRAADPARTDRRLVRHALAVVVHGDRLLHQQGLDIPWPVAGHWSILCFAALLAGAVFLLRRRESR